MILLVSGYVHAGEHSKDEHLGNEYLYKATLCGARPQRGDRWGRGASWRVTCQACKREIEKRAQRAREK